MKRCWYGLMSPRRCDARGRWQYRKGVLSRERLIASEAIWCDEHRPGIKETEEAQDENSVHRRPVQRRV